MNDDDILVTIAHNWGDTEVTLSHWIAHGPGPRWRVRPIAARDRRTGATLPLRTIPLMYRNTPFSRLLIRWGLLKKPAWDHVSYQAQR